MKALSRVYGENIDVGGMLGRSMPTTWMLRMHRSHSSRWCFATRSGFVLPANQGRVKFNRRPGSLWFAGYTDYNVGLLGLGDHALVDKTMSVLPNGQIDVLIPSFVSTNSTAGRRHVRRRLFAAEDYLTMQVARFTRLKRRSIPSRQ